MYIFKDSLYSYKLLCILCCFELSSLIWLYDVAIIITFRIGRETLIRNSTAIRLLLFPRGPILGVSVRIDGEEAGACTRDSTLENLYTLEWNQDQYTMVHTMEVKVPEHLPLYLLCETTTQHG
jgi:hypothetical protein